MTHSRNIQVGTPSIILERITQSLSFDEKKILCASLDATVLNKKPHLNENERCTKTQLTEPDVLKHLVNLSAELVQVLDKGSKDVSPDSWDADKYSKIGKSAISTLDTIDKHWEEEELDEAPPPLLKKKSLSECKLGVIGRTSSRKSLATTKNIRDAFAWRDRLRFGVSDINRVATVYQQPLLPSKILSSIGIALNALDFSFDAGVSLVSAALPREGEKDSSYLNRLSNRLVKDDRHFRMTGSFLSTALNVAGFIAKEAIMKSTLSVAGVAVSWFVVIAIAIHDINKYNNVLENIQKEIDDLNNKLARVNNDIKKIEDSKIHIESLRSYLSRWNDKNNIKNEDRVNFIRAINDCTHLSVSDRKLIKLIVAPSEDVQASQELFVQQKLAAEELLNEKNDDLIHQQKALYSDQNACETAKSRLSAIHSSVETQKQAAISKHRTSIALQGLLVVGMILFVSFAPEIAAWALLTVGLFLFARRVYNTELVQGWFNKFGHKNPAEEKPVEQPQVDEPKSPLNSPVLVANPETGERSRLLTDEKLKSDTKTKKKSVSFPSNLSSAGETKSVQDTRSIKDLLQQNRSNDDSLRQSNSERSRASIDANDNSAAQPPVVRGVLPNLALLGSANAAQESSVSDADVQKTQSSYKCKSFAGQF